MDIYTPYFYIIHHRPTNKFYAGARWAKGCHPTELMVDFGYKTSSKVVSRMIDSFGLSSFDIILVDTHCEGLHPRDYEHEFLLENKICSRENWINISNNFDPVSGDKSHMKCPFFISEFKERNRTRYGSDWFMGTKEFYSKSKITLLERYGVENPSQIPEIQTKKEETLSKNFGSKEEAYSEFAKRRSITNIKNIGVENVLSKDSPYFEKKNQTVSERYGVSNVFQDETVKSKIKQSNLEKYGVDNCAKLQVTCPHCNKTGGYNGMKRWHFDKCKSIYT